MRKNSQSIFDRLLEIMPQLKLPNSKGKDHIGSDVAKSLFSIWRTGKTNSDKRTFKRPVSLAYDDIQKMKSAGLIKFIGDNIEITSKGEKVIKIMILGDERSSFDDNDIIIDYSQALDNTKGMKTANNNMIK